MSKSKCNGITHYACDEMIKKHGGKTKCCGCTGHKCTDQSSEDRVIEAFGKEFSPKNICGNCINLNFIHRFLRQALSDYRRELIEEIIDTVPNYFGRIVRFPESKSTIEDEIHDRVCKKNEDEIAKWKQSMSLRNNRLT